MKYVLAFVLLLFGTNSLIAQDFYGSWTGMITEGQEQFKFEINIRDGERSDPAILYCRSCKRLKGNIVDHRNTEKLIDYFGIINKDASLNLIDSKIAYKDHPEGEIYSRYQFTIEIKKGEAWLIGYYQDYNSKGRKVKQGKIYLKREKPLAKA